MFADDVAICSWSRKHGGDERSALFTATHSRSTSESVSDRDVAQAGRLSHRFLLLRFCFQNIIKKVSGQKFVYKFVSQPDLAVAEGARSEEESLRRDGANPTSLSKTVGALTSACPTKSLAQVRAFSPE